MNISKAEGTRLVETVRYKEYVKFMTQIQGLAAYHNRRELYYEILGMLILLIVPMLAVYYTRILLIFAKVPVDHNTYLSEEISIIWLVCLLLVLSTRHVFAISIAHLRLKLSYFSMEKQATRASTSYVDLLVKAAKLKHAGSKVSLFKKIPDIEINQDEELTSAQTEEPF